MSGPMTVERRMRLAAALVVLMTMFSGASKAAEQEEINRLLAEALETTEQEEPILLELEMPAGEKLSYLGVRMQLPFLGADEVYDLLNRYPVLCDDGYDYTECFKFTFDSKSTGTILYRLVEDDDILADGYWKAPFEVNDYGICQVLSETESGVEIEILDEDNRMSLFDAEATRSIFELNDSTVRKCFNFSYPEGKDALAPDMIVNQAVVSEMTDQDVTYGIYGSAMTMSETLPMEP